MRGPGRRQVVGLIVLLALAAGAAVVRLLVYRAHDGTWIWGWPADDIVSLRATAVAVAAIVGVALAVSGTLLQTMLRNPLASPFILGISSGAALGVMIAIAIGHLVGTAALRHGTNAGPALVGALVVLALVYLLGQRRGWIDPLSLVLVGVIVSAICGALIMFLQHLVPLGLRGDLVTWMMGAIRQDVGAGALLAVGVVTVGGAGVAVGMGRAMDAATLGDDEARSVGLSLRRLRVIMFLLAGLLASLAVSLAGPIGFVGLIAPHAARLVLGPRHTPLVIGSALIGAALIVGADVAAQVLPVHGGRMPVGVFTALIGGPAFIWLLRSGRGTL
jgi:iron complex transport system permease protein